MSPRHLGPFEQQLLHAVTHLQRADEGACGPTIRRLLEEETGRVISPGAIYTALDRLERRGLLRSSLGEPTPERGGKRKRMYAMRPGGTTALADAAASLQRLAALSRRRV